MPKIKLGSRLSGLSQGIAGFMDFKKSFDTAMREMAWEKEKLMFGRETELTKTAMATGDIGMRLAGGGRGYEFYTPPEPTLTETGASGIYQYGRGKATKFIKATGDKTSGFNRALTRATTMARDAYTGGIDPNVFKKVWPGIAKEFGVTVTADQILGAEKRSPGLLEKISGFFKGGGAVKAGARTARKVSRAYVANLMTEANSGNDDAYEEIMGLVQSGALSMDDEGKITVLEEE